MKFYRLFYTFVLFRRYRVSIDGLDLLTAKGAKLILPNHQSHIDPQIIAVVCYKYSDIVPVVSERFFKIPVIKFFLRKWGAVSVSDFRTGNRDPKVMANIFSGVFKALEEGKSVIIYPSGELQDTGEEKIKNKQSAHKITMNLPKNTQVLGLRVSGLWGSTFSKAWNGKRPVFITAFLKGIFYWFANLIFLIPKRKVNLEFVNITEETKKQALNDRRTFNKYLEDFFNINGIEEPTYVRHFFFFPKSKRKLPKSISGN